MTRDEAFAANEALVRAYRLTFNSLSGQEVLIDLMKFCRFRAPLNEPIMLDEGKRQVFLRIESFLALTPEELERLFAGRQTIRPAT